MFLVFRSPLCSFSLKCFLGFSNNWKPVLTRSIKVTSHFESFFINMEQHTTYLGNKVIIQFLALEDRLSKNLGPYRVGGGRHLSFLSAHYYIDLQINTITTFPCWHTHYLWLHPFCKFIWYVQSLQWLPMSYPTQGDPAFNIFYL